MLNNNKIFVFDIDGVLCTKLFNCKNNILLKIKQRHPECPIVIYEHKKWFRIKLMYANQDYCDRNYVLANSNIFLVQDYEEHHKFFIIYKTPTNEVDAYIINLQQEQQKTWQILSEIDFNKFHHSFFEYVPNSNVAHLSELIYSTVIAKGGVAYSSEFYPHIFLPYMDILINYLIKFGRIVFFSSAIEERNVFILDQWLAQILSKERYIQLKEQRQFAVYSRQHLRDREENNRDLGIPYEKGAQIKDLRQVLINDEKLINAILLEDQSSYTAYGQHPCVSVIDVEKWELIRLDKNDIKRGNAYKHYFAKNGTYYLLGLFKYYFENQHYNNLDLRPGIEKIYLSNDVAAKNYELCERRCYKPEFNDFTMQMINLGLEEVHKTYPQAILYGTDLKLYEYY